MRKSIEQRFWSRVAVMSDQECWEWQGTLKRPCPTNRRILPYGQFGFRDNGKIKTISAHRFSYALRYGPIPKGACVLHSCDNPKCVNPRHLFLGTQKDNVQDTIKKGRAKPPKSNARLSENEVMEIRSLYPILNQRQIANRFGIARAHVSQIIHRKCWRDLP